MRRCEVAYSGMKQDVANKDERIMVWSVVALSILNCKKLLYIVLELAIKLFQTRNISLAATQKECKYERDFWLKKQQLYD